MREVDDLGPLVGFGCDDFADVGRRTDNLGAAEIVKPLRALAAKVGQA
jgi:hypothetical protein